jgi:hypothetical protein
MIKQELKNGNIILRGNGDKSIVMGNMLLNIIDLSSDCDLSDYDESLNDLEDGGSEWKIVKIYDNIIDMNLLWERPTSNIKAIGYEYKGFKLGQSVMVEGKKCNIIGFDERGNEYGYINNPYFILVTAEDSQLQFQYATAVTAHLDVSNSQRVKWIREYDIQTDLNNGEHKVQIEENECIVEPTPKVKLPKYVRVTKCSIDFYWYKDKIGKVYKVEELRGDGNAYVVKFESSLGKYGIDIEDCEPVSKEELMQVGMLVKVKKSKLSLVNIPDVVYEIQGVYRNATEVTLEGIKGGIDTSYLKPYLKESD